MACPITDNSQRKYALKQPAGWQPKVPRWTLRFPNDIQELVIAYVGVQHHGVNSQEGQQNGHRKYTNGASNGEPVGLQQATRAIEEWATQGSAKPTIVDRLAVEFGRDISGSKVWACYWTSKAAAEQSLNNLDLSDIHNSLPQNQQESTGLWLEVLYPDLTRFETNYSGDDYRPGIAGLKGTTQEPHNLTGYWGAARDRIQASAFDDFVDDDPKLRNPHTVQKETNRLHLSGTNTHTIAHIRSGQFWENCADDEREAYENDLEPYLIAGLKDIYKRPQDLGDYGLRFLRNVAPSGLERNSDSSEHLPRETCAAGFSRTLADLENWAKNCPSHHKIYGGAMHHKQKFAERAKFRTWHEVCVLKPGEARWEYTNCVKDTGTIQFQQSEIKT